MLFSGEAPMNHRARLLEETRQAYSRRAALQAELHARADRPPETGDVFAVERTADFGVEWVVLAHEGADARRLLAVPADGGALLGSGDLEIPESAPAGALILRCRFGTWLDAALLSKGRRVGVLAADDVERARERWSAIARGETVGSKLERETDADPEYQDWIEDFLEPAQQAMSDADIARSAAPKVDAVPQDLGSRAGLPDAGEVPRGGGSYAWRWLALAASILIFVGSLALWRQHLMIRELMTSQEIAEDESRRNRQLLADARQRAERELQQARVDAAEARERELRKADEQLANLGRRLQEALRASTIRNPAIVALEPPGELRGNVDELQIPAGASHVLLLLPLRDVSPSPKYRAELMEKNTGQKIWAGDELIPMTPGELRLGFPASLLAPGEYRLRISGLEDETSRPMKECVLRIKTE